MRALSTLIHALRTALVSAGIVKGRAWAVSAPRGPRRHLQRVPCPEFHGASGLPGDPWARIVQTSLNQPHRRVPAGDWGHRRNALTLAERLPGHQPVKELIAREG